MKILHIIDSLGLGGAERVLYDLLKADHPVNEHMVVCLTGEDHFSKSIRSLGVEVVCLDVKAYNFILCFYRLFKIIKRNRHSFLLCWMYYSALIAGCMGWFLEIKNIVWLFHDHGVRAESDDRLKMILIILSKISGIIPKAITVPSQKSYEAHIKGYNFKKNKIHVVSNPLNPFFFRSPSSTERGLAQEKLGLKQGKITVGFIGRNHRIKSPELFIEIAKRVHCSNSEVDFLMLGSNIDCLKIRKMVKNSSLENCFSICSSIHDPRIFYWSVDLVVVTSREESFCNIIPESLLSEVPCISSNVGIANELIPYKEWVISSRDPEKYAKTILSVLAMPSEIYIKKIKETMRVEIKERSIENMIDFVFKFRKDP